ncbi:MAG: long-chain fatty acid--CoA ligase [Chitinophagaceae bacterium]|nr:MAG: long-chain fatty acid--CoA ligase [Chitinophagaceae bacterium]
MEFKRLFDAIYHQKENYPQDDALVSKIDGKWVKLTSADIIDKVNELSVGLLKYGIQKGDKIAMISNNRPEWNIVDLAMLQIGAVNVPVYPTITESDYKFIFNDSEVKMIFVSDEDLFQKAENIKNDIPSLKGIFTFDKIEGADHWSKLSEMGKNVDLSEVENIKSTIASEDLATIIYTSGTTGLPKGVMLSHYNIVSNIESTGKCLPIESAHRALSFLPLCHIFERMVLYTYIYKGVSVYYAENLETIADNLKEVKPHFFTSVPRLLEKVYDKIVAKGNELTGIKKKLFFWALELGLEFDEKGNNSNMYNFQLNIARKLIFSKWKEALGGEIIGICSGAAALQPRLARVFNAAGIHVREGYGQTESSPVITFNRFEEGDYNLSTVGVPIPGVEVKIDEETGEILARGPNLMMGYYKRPDLTAETIDKDGWLHTGDKGEWIDGKFLKITDRIKELFKTSGGKYVAPQVVENKFKESIYIEQIIVIGENKNFVSALIVPSFINLSNWCMKNGVNAKSHKEMVEHADVISLFQTEVDRFNPEFGRVEQIKKFVLMPEEWSVEGGELTPTMKVKRKVIMEKYADTVENIYKNPN